MGNQIRKCKGKLIGGKVTVVLTEGGKMTRLFLLFLSLPSKMEHLHRNTYKFAYRVYYFNIQHFISTGRTAFTKVNKYTQAYLKTIRKATRTKNLKVVIATDMFGL